MAVLDAVKKVLAPPAELVAVPASVDERLKRGRANMREKEAERKECLRFWRGDQYVYRVDGRLVAQSTQVSVADQTGGKPRHRVRTTRNLILDFVAREVAAATQRIPDYEIDPSTSDPEDVSAARLAEKVAHYGYDKWDIRRVTEQAVTYAVVAAEGFVWPYWDSTVGPYMQDAEGNVIGQGEVGIRVFGPNEAYWEPGLKFDESPWHAIEQARTPESVYDMDGYVGPPKLESDGTDDKGRSKLVLVTEYLERPNKRFPDGRWLTIANGKQVVPARPFPCRDPQGNVVDEPVLHMLSYFTDPDEDRDQGLVKHMLDAQRTYNDCNNKQLEWKNLALNPQVIAKNLQLKQRLTDEPGAVYTAVGSGDIIWRPVPPIPSELGEIKQEAKMDMAQIGAQNQIPSGLTSAAGVQGFLQWDASRRAPFLANVAEFHSRLMRHCLYLVQRHYTEPRLLKIRGRFGPELIADFLGSDLKGQVDVTVFPGSIEPRTRQEVENRVMSWAQLGWVTAEQAMAAIDGGTAEQLVESYELDVARANEIIQTIKAGPDVLFNLPTRQPFPGEQAPVDPQTGQEMPIPGWMPRPFDNMKVWKVVLSDWMKTTDYASLPLPSQEAANAVYAGLLELEAQQAAREAAMQTQMAQNLGMANAAKPQVGSPMPSFPGANGAVNAP